MKRSVRVIKSRLVTAKSKIINTRGVPTLQGAEGHLDKLPKHGEQSYWAGENMFQLRAFGGPAQGFAVILVSCSPQAKFLSRLPADRREQTRAASTTHDLLHEAHRVLIQALLRVRPPVRYLESAQQAYGSARRIISDVSSIKRKLLTVHSSTKFCMAT
jgi:hypothetical protein